MQQRIDTASNQRPSDFDPLIGSWTVHHRRLRERLSDSNEWEEFSGTSTTRPILGGFGVVEDNWLDLPGGGYRATAIRTFDLGERSWAIWWIDGRTPHHLDPPVVGGFADGVGTFLANDTFDRRPIVVRFVWSGVATETPRWEQAFSDDAGLTWETNWTMDFARCL